MDVSQNVSRDSKPALCNYCQAIIDEDFDCREGKEVAFEHHEDFWALELSAGRGCGLCAHFISNLDHEDERLTNSKGEVSLWIGEEQRYRMLKLRFPDGDFEYEGVCYLYPAQERAIDYNSAEPSTRDALPLCKKWLRECMASHESCRSRPEARLPTRLIDISTEGPRVCLSHEVDPNAPYATLSHCWGKVRFLTLNKDTSDVLRTRIPPEALSKTFQDAIHIAQYLGFHYIWIDSLCIVQDDIEDWKRESVLMTSVYGGAALNIAASSAEDGNGGCFFPRNTAWRYQIRKFADGKEKLYECLPERAHSALKGPLNTRAWVLQERYLSRRTLHFHEDQVFWECDQERACEVFPSGFSLDDRSTFKWDKKPSLTLDTWPRVVAEYSRAQLTHKSDKLVAIDGVAQMIKSETKEEYVAGLWRIGIEKQLCWVVQNLGQRITPHQAPSWSWASVEGSIWFPRECYQEEPKSTVFIRLIDISVDPALQSSTAQTSSAGLLLRCDMFSRGVLHHSSDIHARVTIGNTSFEAFVGLDCSPIQSGDENSTEAFFLPVMRTVSETAETSENIRGLLLAPTGGRDGYYERIGYFLVPSSQCPRVQDIMATKSQLVASDYIDVVEDAEKALRYLIKIV